MNLSSRVLANGRKIILVMVLGFSGAAFGAHDCSTHGEVKNSFYAHADVKQPAASAYDGEKQASCTHDGAKQSPAVSSNRSSLASNDKSIANAQSHIKSQANTGFDDNIVTQYARILWDWAITPVRNLRHGLAERNVEKIAKGAAGIAAYGVCAWGCYSIIYGWPGGLAAQGVASDAAHRRTAADKDVADEPMRNPAEPRRPVLTPEEERQVEIALGMNPDHMQGRRQAGGWQPETDDQRLARYGAIAARGYFATGEEIMWQVAMNDQQYFEWNALVREQGRRQNRLWLQRELLRARRAMTIELYGAEFGARLRREAQRENRPARIALSAQARRPIRVVGHFDHNNGCMRHNADNHRGFQDVGHAGNIRLGCGHVICTSCVHTMIRSDSLLMEEIANLVCDICEIPFAYDLCDDANAEIIFGKNQQRANEYNNLIARLEELDANPPRKYCPACSVGVDLVNSDVPQEIVCQTAACQARGFRFCGGCCELVHEGSCAQYRADLEAQLAQQALQRWSKHEDDVRRLEQIGRQAAADEEEVLREHAQRRAEWAQRVQERANR